MYEILQYVVLALQSVTSNTGATVNPLGRPLGYLVIGIIEFPVVILFLAALLGKPRSTKITSLFVGWIFMMLIVFICAVFGLSWLLGIFY
ncbi:MAG: hypothetical protein NWE89_15005 [Candidatus Bathyarchaeota archaeon]|nr:hypothetical protein [Candidatus Bathyarchaeota archaeon]